jgi:hypothetical protein
MEGAVVVSKRHTPKQSCQTDPWTGNPTHDESIMVKTVKTIVDKD